jgi:hypothetical protein
LAIRVKDDSLVCYQLSEMGKEVFKSTISQRQKRFISLIVSHLAFKKVLAEYF